MSLPFIFFTAIGLSMDAFAVSISCGISAQKTPFKVALRCALAFGLFQFGMTLLGYLLGSSFSELIVAYDHWVAFILLALIGGKMVLDAFSKEGAPLAITSLKILITLAIATSIDALAVGVSFSALRIDIMTACIMIGCTTFVLSFIGVYTGRMLQSDKYDRFFNLFGGLILIVIGTKILIEHLWLS